VLAHVVVVDRLVDQLPGAIADGLPVDLDRWVGPHHLQVEYVPAGPDRLDHAAQDVHDVLRVYSSERPGEDDRVERVRLLRLAILDEPREPRSSC